MSTQRTWVKRAELSQWFVWRNVQSCACAVLNFSMRLFCHGRQWLLNEQVRKVEFYICVTSDLCEAPFWTPERT